MKKKLMLTCAAILVIAMITVPVMAAPPAITGNPVDQILTIVQNIQTKVGTILTSLTSLQTDVTTIKTNTDNILQAPPEPTSYEYYTAVIMLCSETSEGYTLVPRLLNNGDTPADVCFERYYCYDYTFCHPYLLDERSQCFTIEPRDVTGPDYWMNDIKTSNYIKINTTSKNVVPHIYISDWETDEIVQEYLPGDFLKVEVYN